MIIEGLPTFILGIATFFLLADDPAHAHYLSADEAEFLRLRRLREQGETANAQKFHWADVKKGLTDWRMLAFAAGQFGVDTMVWRIATDSITTNIELLALWVQHLLANNHPTDRGLEYPSDPSGALLGNLSE